MIESKLANEDQTMMVSKAGSLYTQLAGPDSPASKTRLEIQANNSSLNLGPLSSLGRVSCGGRVQKGSATWRTEILWLETNSFAFDELTHLSFLHHGEVDNDEEQSVNHNVTTFDILFSTARLQILGSSLPNL